MKLCFVLCSTAVFCTGARDGNIMVWDTRCSKKGIDSKLILNFLNSFCKMVEDNGRNPIFVSVWCYYIFLSDGFYRQVKQISGAHNKAEPNPPSKTKKRRSSMRGMAPSVVSFLNNWPDLCLLKKRLKRGRGMADLIALHLFCRIPSRVSQWFCFEINTPSSLQGLLMGKKLLLLVRNMSCYEMTISVNRFA